MNLSKKVLGHHDCSLLHCVFKFVITRVHCDFELLRNSRCKNKTIVNLWRTSSTEVITRCFIQTLRKKCPYLEFFWSVSSPNWTNYGDLPCKSPYSVQMRENTDQRNSKYGQFSGSERTSHK